MRFFLGAVTIIVDHPIDVTEYHDKSRERYGHGAIASMNKVHEIFERNYARKEAVSDLQSAFSS